MTSSATVLAAAYFFGHHLSMLERRSSIVTSEMVDRSMALGRRAGERRWESLDGASDVEKLETYRKMIPEIIDEMRMEA